jgi:hypothetical protein
MGSLRQPGNAEGQLRNRERLAPFWGPAHHRNTVVAFGRLAAVPAEHAIRTSFLQQPGIQRIIEIFANRPAHRARALHAFVPKRAGTLI